MPPKPLSEAARRAISGVEVDGRIVRIRAQLERSLYQEVNKALEAIGGKWNRKAQGHVFEADPQEAIDQLVETGTYTNKARELAYFPTPPALAEEVVDRAGVREDDVVLEPSAGTGSLIDQLPVKTHLVAVELDPSRTTTLAAKMTRFLSKRLVNADFLAMKAEPIVDVVVMNPPFDKRADIDHVLHAMGFLRPGGRLVAIMSAGVTFREDSKAVMFRAAVHTRGGTIEPLPDDSFKASGTGVRTCLVVIPGSDR